MMDPAFRAMFTKGYPQMAADYLDQEDRNDEELEYIDFNSLPNDQQQYFLQNDYDNSQFDERSDDQNI